MTEEKTTMVDSRTTCFDERLEDFARAEADLRAATARRDAARRDVVLCRPLGVTSVEVARRLKAAAVADHEPPPAATPRS